MINCFQLASPSCGQRRWLFFLYWLLVNYSCLQHVASIGDSNAATFMDVDSAESRATKVLEHIWEKLSQSIQQHARSNSAPGNNDSIENDSDHQQQTAHHASLTAPHLTTRGGGVTGRRRSLLEHALHHHYSQQRRSSFLQTAYSTFRYDHHTPSDSDNAQHHLAPDRSRSLHAAFPPLPPSRRQANRDLLRDMFTHAYDSYMLHGWPQAEVRPVSCEPGTFDLIKVRGLTLIDSLDTLIVLGNYTEFARAVERLRHEHLSIGTGLFDVNENVSVFETTIRVLGGLLSAHQLALAYLSTNSSTKINNVTRKKQKNTKASFVIAIPESDVFTETGQVRWGYDVKREAAPDQATEEAQPSETCCAFPANSEACESNKKSFPLVRDNECGLHSGTVNDTAKHTAQEQSESERYWTYDNFLLDLAVDLGERLLPAFDTRTGIPFGTVNLKFGVPYDETTVASLAGGGTLTMEFEMLSRLTGDDRFGKAAKLASRALWMRRSKAHGLNLLGKHIDIQKGQWTESLSGIGSNSDSFLEYLVKQYVLFPEDDDFWTMFTTAYGGVYEHSRVGEWYVDTDMNTGANMGKSRHVLESLMAFYPGMQVLLGENTPAARSLNSFFLVRELLGFLPERFNFGTWNVDGGRGHASLHPLRPELLESCYFLHRATQGMKVPDASSGWLWAADFALHKLETVTRATCGYSTVSHVSPRSTGSVDGSVDPQSIHHENEMPSFFLSETIKYLYLTFDDDNILHRDDERQWIFTTEAHPMHHVPLRDKKLFADEVTSLKSILREVINDQRPRVKPENRLLDEDWTDHTMLTAYNKDLSQSRAALTRRKTGMDIFFTERQLLHKHVARVSADAFSDTDRNWAHITLKNTGSESHLRKACPNAYSSDLLWMHALNGGATDYSEIYVSVTTDNIEIHPNSFIALGAADALGVLGSGLYPGQLDDTHTCPVTALKKDESSAEEPMKTETPSKTGKSTTAEAKVNMDLGQFQVATFSDGGGFVVDHVPTGDKVISTFVFEDDKPGAEAMYMMVYAGYSIEGERSRETPSEGSVASSIWRMKPAAANKSANGSNTKSSFRRNVIIADLEGNSFSCNVEVYLGEPHDGELENVVATLPCSPGLFGRTHVRYLRENGGVIVNAYLLPPREADEFGCGSDKENVEHDTTDESNEVGSEPLVSDTNDQKPDARSSIQVVHRGDCTFYAKAVHMKTHSAAEAVIVVNTEEDELFTMSHGGPDDDGVDEIPSQDVPITILITGLDGEDLISIVNGQSEGQVVSARVSVERQNFQSDPQGNIVVSSEDDGWPVVRGAQNSIQIFARGGWGVHAFQREFGGRLDWNLHLLQYNANL